MGPPLSSKKRKDLASSTQTPSNRLCRICCGPGETSGANPILLLGCTCKGDSSYGHQSCMKKWFRMRLQRNGFLSCEVCRSPLGARVENIVRSYTIAEVIQRAPRLLLLLQVPPEDLDHLQVPLKTPGFYQLPLETRRSLEASFARLQQEQRRGQSRRRETFEVAQLESSAVVHGGGGDPSEAVLQVRDGYRTKSVKRLGKILLRDFLELWEVNFKLPFGPPVGRVFTEHYQPRIHSIQNRLEAEGDRNPVKSVGFPEGPVIRVPIIEREHRVHKYPVDELINELMWNAVRLVDLHGENLMLLPNYMDTYFLEVNEPLLTTPSTESHGNVDDVPVASPERVNSNPSSSGADPVPAESPLPPPLPPPPGTAEPPRPTGSTSGRLYTYARFEVFHLLQ